MVRIKDSHTDGLGLFPFGLIILLFTTKRSIYQSSSTEKKVMLLYSYLAQDPRLDKDEALGPESQSGKLCKSDIIKLITVVRVGPV